MIRWTVSLSRSLSARAFVPFAIVINKLLDKIPGFDKLNIDSEGMKKKFGLMGEPLFLGIVIGCGIGFGLCQLERSTGRHSGYPWIGYQNGSGYGVDSTYHQPFH